MERTMVVVVGVGIANGTRETMHVERQRFQALFFMRLFFRRNENGSGWLGGKEEGRGWREWD